MHKIFNKFILFFFTLTLSTSIYAQISNIQYKWKLEKVIYSDNSELKLDPGNFVVIDQNTILEVMTKYGNRRYPYHRKSDVLYLTSGDSEVKWKILFCR